MSLEDFTKAVEEITNSDMEKKTWALKQRWFTSEEIFDLIEKEENGELDNPKEALSWVGISSGLLTMFRDSNVSEDEIFEKFLDKPIVTEKLDGIYLGTIASRLFHEDKISNQKLDDWLHGDQLRNKNSIKIIQLKFLIAKIFFAREISKLFD